MTATLKALFAKGWLDFEKLHTLEALLNLCGPDWFADRLVLVGDWLVVCLFVCLLDIRLLFNTYTLTLLILFMSFIVSQTNTTRHINFTKWYFIHSLFVHSALTYMNKQ